MKEEIKNKENNKKEKEEKSDKKLSDEEYEKKILIYKRLKYSKYL